MLHPTKLATAEGCVMRDCCYHTVRYSMPRPSLILVSFLSPSISEFNTPAPSQVCLPPGRTARTNGRIATTHPLGCLGLRRCLLTEAGGIMKQKHTVIPQNAIHFVHCHHAHLGPVLVEVCGFGAAVAVIQRQLSELGVCRGRDKNGKPNSEDHNA